MMQLQKKRSFKRNSKYSTYLPLLKELAIASNILVLDNTYSMYPEPSNIVSNGYKAKNLIITNKHCSLQWKGEVDLSSIKNYCLRDILDFGKDYVEVYPNGSPNIGVELNKPCIATFFKAIDMSKTKMPYAKLLKLLKKRSEKEGLNLISFDYETGQLKVKIDHFTKYSINIQNQLDEKQDQVHSDSYQASQQYFEKVQYQKVPLNFFKRNNFKQQNVQPQKQQQKKIDRYQFPSFFDGPKIKDARQSSPIHDYSQPLKLNQRVPTSSITISQREGNLIANHNFQNYNYIPNPLNNVLGWDLIFGGSGFKYLLKRGLTEYSVSILPPNQISNQQKQSLGILSSIEFRSPFNQITKILSTNKLSSNYLQAISLFNILFNDNNHIKIINNNYIQAQILQNQQNSLKDWLQKRMIQQPIKSKSNNLVLLLQRKIPQFYRYLMHQSRRRDLAQIVSKLQDKAFLSLYNSNIKDVPSQINSILTQTHLSFVEGQTWISRIAMNIFYNKQIEIVNKIQEVLRTVREDRINNFVVYRLFNLFVAGQIDNTNRQYEIVNNYESLENQILSWFFSNLLMSRQQKLIEKSEYFKARHRQLKNLLGRVVDYQSKIRIIKYDNSLSDRQKSQLITNIIATIPPSQANVKQLSTFQRIISESIRLINSNQSFQALSLLNSTPETQQTKFNQSLLQTQTQFIFSNDKSKKQSYLQFISHFDANPILSLYRLFMNIEMKKFNIDNQLLIELIEHLNNQPNNIVNKAANTLIFNSVMQNKQYYGRLFKNQGFNDNKIFQYLMKVTSNDKKSNQRVKALKLPQL